MSFREQFPLLTSYSTGYGRYYDFRRLNCSYNKATIYAETGILDNNLGLIEEAKDICREILDENKHHMEARLLLNYLCGL